MKNNHTPEQPFPSHLSMSREQLLAHMIAEAWNAPTEFDRERAISAIHIIGAGMSQAEMTNAGLRAVELLHAAKA